MPHVCSSPTSRRVARLCLWLAMHAYAGAAAVGDDSAADGLPEATILARVIVLGSHIRRPDLEGPSPVSRYDRDYIEASGALRLADFLNLLPQNYTGSGSGRGSAPNDFNPEFGVRTETGVPPFSFIFGAAATPLGQSGVSGANLRGFGSGSTLVLVDGRRRPIAGQGNRSTDSRQGFVDLNTIPLGMVERIEVLADGASALYGSDAIGGVINVVLKKNYTGAEFSTDYKGAFDGGGRERHATWLAGFTSKDARLRGMIGVDFYDRARLSAAQRTFSANQDHTARVAGYAPDGRPVRGRDFRLNWGYPAVVQARTGYLQGVTNPDGTPVSVALVPDGAGVTPAPAQFVATSLTSVSRARVMNTADYLTLVSPQETFGIGGAVEYVPGRGARVYGGFSLSDVRGVFEAQPPVSAASASTGFGRFATIVPAMIDGQPNAFNPFGQEVLVGLVHHEFGPTRQTTRTVSRGVYAGVARDVGDGWEWDAGVSRSHERFAQRNITLDHARFTAALAAPDPAQRFNPFVDARAGAPANARIYAGLTAIDADDGVSEYTAAHFAASGPLLALPGGDLQLAFGGDYGFAEHRVQTRPSAGAVVDAAAGRHSHAVFAELSAPLVGRANARRFARRVELQLAGRYEHHGEAGDTANPKFCALWSPAPWLLARSGFSTGFRAPSLSEYETTRTVETSTLTDPRRASVRTANLSVHRGSNAGAGPETSRSEFHGVVLTPLLAPGLSIALDYHRTRQRNLLQLFTAQAIVDNERLFPGRITRLEPTAEDIALGQPGPLASVDATFVNFGASHHESLDLALEYELPWRDFGRFRVSLGGSHALVARVELQPGVEAS
ncbi:MAG TPA: TonB-dependent receptor, partial [Opitutus sp.]|nr:TonB-dependent receptor [Opitutus sp.]